MIFNVLCAIAINAFFFPRRAANDQYLPANHVFFVLEIAHATSHNVDFMCGFPLVVRVLFFYPHFRDFLVLSPPMMLDVVLKGIDSFQCRFRQ